MLYENNSEPITLSVISRIVVQLKLYSMGLHISTLRVGARSCGASTRAAASTCAAASVV